MRYQIAYRSSRKLGQDWDTFGTPQKQKRAYLSVNPRFVWWLRRDLSPGPQHYESAANSSTEPGDPIECGVFTSLILDLPVFCSIPA